MKFLKAFELDDESSVRTHVKSYLENLTGPLEFNFNFTYIEGKAYYPLFLGVP